jgi:hypothetical protein
MGVVQGNVDFFGLKRVQFVVACAIDAASKVRDPSPPTNNPATPMINSLRTHTHTQTAHVHFVCIDTTGAQGKKIDTCFTEVDTIPADFDKFDLYSAVP